MEVKKIHIIGIAVSSIIIILSLFFMGTRFFFVLMGTGILVGITPFVFSLINEARVESEKEEMFLEFARNLVESVRAGTPISKSITNIKDKPYGVLSENIKKLANQIYLGVPLSTALRVFARDVNNKTISRALTLIGQAERSGGDIGEILESVAHAVNMTDKLKKERRAVISTLVVQGYIIFSIFLIIVLIMQFKIIPLLAGVGSLGGISGGGSLSTLETGNSLAAIEISSAFLYLILIQGFFSGLVIGQLSEGTIKAGVKHSFILMVLAFSVSTGANLFFG
ncbi:MAG: type II secretion system F family protein [Nanoarchaeota archaeon]